MKIEKIKAIGNFVVLKAITLNDKKEKKTNAGIILPEQEEKYGTNVNNATSNGKLKVKLIVESIGGEVDKAKYDLNVGDEVICDNYDLQTIGDDNTTYCLCKITSIKCVVSSTE